MHENLTPEGGTAVIDRTDTDPVLDDGSGHDENQRAHYVGADRLAEAAVSGGAVTALCGKVWKPRRNPEGLPVCPECKELWESMNPSDESGEQQ